MKFLLKIPFRVAVSKLFPYCLISTDDLKELDLFGYFEKDVTKKIFFLFSSIVVRLDFRKCVIDFSRLYYFEIRGVLSETVNQLIQASPEMTNLNRLEIIQGFRPFTNDSRMSRSLDLNTVNFGKFEMLFSRPNCFPKLKKFGLAVYQREIHGQRVDARGWGKASHIWKNIETLKLKCGFVDGSWMNSWNNVKSLRDLEVDCIELPSKIEINLPNLRNFTVHKCVNFQVHPGGKLYRLYVKDVSLYENILMNEPNLKVLKIQFGRRRTDTLINEKLFTERMKDFEDITLFGLIFPEERFTEFGEGLRILNIVFCRNFREEFIVEKTKNLESLALEDLEFGFTGNKVFSFCENLKHLKLSSVNHINEKLFMKNHFTRLQTLFINNTGMRFSKKWNRFPELREISFFYCTRLDDNFFISNNENFPSLEDLDIDIADKVKCKGWGKEISKNIKNMNLRQLKPDISFLEEEDRTPNLEILVMWDLKGKFGHYEWKSFRNLRCLKFINCEISDDLFRSGVLQNLEKLELIKCRSFTGENWKFYPKMRKVKIVTTIEDFKFRGRESFPEDVSFSQEFIRLTF